MRILLVDDHSLFIEGLQNLLQASGYEVVGAAYDGLEALDIARQLHPDLILMDVRMPRCNGLEATRLIKAELPEVKIVMLTTSPEEDDLFEALKSGACGYLLKNLKPNELFDQLAGLERGEAALSRELSASLVCEFAHQANELDGPRGIRQFHAASEWHPANREDHTRVEPPEIQPGVKLTTRQSEILKMVAEGLSYKEVGEHLHVSKNTVKYHMGEILQRLHVKNREQVVVYALSTGLVPSVGDAGQSVSFRKM